MVAPVLGQFTAWALFVSSVPSMLRDRKKGQLSVDPTPFPVTLVCTLLWIVYAAIKEDLWIFSGNFVGVGAAAFNTLTVFQLCRDDRVLLRMEIVVVLGLLLVATTAILSLTQIFFVDLKTRQSVAGAVCTIVIIGMFAAPSLEALVAIRTANASKLSLPLAIAQFANGMLWSVYGLAQGDLVLLGPNAAGAILALCNIVVKVWCSSHGKLDSEVSSQHRPLEVIQQGGEVIVRALVQQGYIHVGDDALDGELESDTEAADAAVPWQAVCSASQGSVFRIVPAPVGGGNISLQTEGGQFLCIRPRPTSMNGSCLVPSPLSVVAEQRDEPGDEGVFLPVCCQARDTDPLMQNSTSVHNYSEESVSFWNPLYRVFLRMNESGVVDCSPVCNPLAHGATLPAGWDWERFTLQPAGVQEGLRCRHPATVVGNAGASERGGA